MRLFNLRNSVMNRTVLSFLGRINVGAAHSERLTFHNIPALTSRSTSIFKVSSYARGIGYARA